MQKYTLPKLKNACSFESVSFLSIFVVFVKGDNAPRWPAARAGRTSLAEGQKSPNDGEKDGGQQVGDLDLFAPHQIEANTKDENVAGE